jgi:DNA repair/transcription protein MET18/MMS19
LVFGVCAAIEEEKDPRCLLLVFRIVESLTLVFPNSDGPVADCAEDLFDIVSRYFPISFNPQAGGGGGQDGITKADLVTSLKVGGLSLCHP